MFVKIERIHDMKKLEYMYVGMDIHKEPHTAVCLNYMEEELGQIQINNTIEGFKRLHAYVKKISKNLTPIVGLEDVKHYGRSLAIYLLAKETYETY